MKKKFLLIPTIPLILVFFILNQSCSRKEKQSVKNLPQPITLDQDYPIQPVIFTSVKFEDEFWSKRLETAKNVTIPFTLDQTELTGRIKNFRIAAGQEEGGFCSEYPFDDSDVFKILEGASYVLMMEDNPKLEAKVDSLIALIGDAQEPDGYLYTNRSILGDNAHPWAGQKRWELTHDLSHELYNIGHLIESGVAHYYATGKKSLIDIAIKAADRVSEDFGSEKLVSYPGHQIIELALAKLYRATGNQKYLETSEFLLEARKGGSEYSQSHIPVTEQFEAVGHAVRGVYMYSGMADIAAIKQNQAYITAINSIWEDVVSKKMYITGGIGSTGHGEAFGAPYELPNMAAYCETCASIGNVYWNHRLFMLHGDGKYYDVLERTLYNSLLSGVGMSGDSFFYPNPLESHGQHERSPWFPCACCPSNVARFIPSVPGYFYAIREDELFINLFASSTADVTILNNKVNIIQNTQYPWEGKIDIEVNPESEAEFEIKVRIPGWSNQDQSPGGLYQFANKVDQTVQIQVNGEPYSFQTEKGYAILAKSWKKGDKITVNLPMPVRMVKSHDQVSTNQDKLAIQRGPLIYAAEWADQEDQKVLNVVLQPDSEFSVKYNSALLGGVNTIHSQAKALIENENGELESRPKELTLIPYYAWAHRGPGEMQVWLPTKEEDSKPSRNPSIASKSKLSGSHPTKALKAINDQMEPSNSNDNSILFYHWWPKKDTTEWLQYDFDQPYQIKEAEVYWFDDGPFGGTRIPAKWRILYHNGLEWVPVEPSSPYEIKKDQFSKVSFTPVLTQSLRLEVTLPKEHASGVMEWKVN
ncbi:glycoside hydrolase family 127 protein [Algoriphagus sp.]|uniref:glycoside hydrolase family 127 protein n=1 Tax=Algoriphagus sp. TaxID=1872435 RepID=UPI002603B9AD|nr:glycoside hydrolase family 127 protein [Algoriphagus sp.]